LQPVIAAATAATLKAIEAIEKLGTDDWKGVTRRFKQQCEAADQFQWECAVDPLLSGKTPGQCQNHWIDKLDPSFLSLEHFSRYSPI
jgi:hypothetical protein